MTKAVQQKARAWDLWLDCLSEREIKAEIVVPQKTINDWVSEIRTDPDFAQPPVSRQHFDVWSFQTAADVLVPLLASDPLGAFHVDDTARRNGLRGGLRALGFALILRRDDGSTCRSALTVQTRDPLGNCGHVRSREVYRPPHRPARKGERQRRRPVF